MSVHCYYFCAILFSIPVSLLLSKIADTPQSFLRKLFHYLKSFNFEKIHIRHEKEEFDIKRGNEVVYYHRTYLRYGDAKWLVKKSNLFIEKLPFCKPSLVERVFWEELPLEECRKLEKILSKKDNAPV